MSRSFLRPTLIYLAMFPVTGAMFWWVCQQGNTSQAPAPAGRPSLGGSPADHAHVDILPHLLLGILTILLAARLVSWAFARVRQPRVMGEVVAGILLGPSVLGWVWPRGEDLIFPSVLAPYLTAIAQLGVVLYMFLVGLELNPAMIRGRARATVAISHASIVVPFMLGSSLALFTYPRWSSSDVSFMSFALFSGVALSVTAFPVLARILTDRQLQTSRLGVIALACAAANDVTAWCLLALVVGVVRAAVQQAVLTIILAMVYLAVMLVIGRPLVDRLVTRFEHAKMTQAVMGAIFIALLASSLVTELIGIHALFGAFLLGAIVPPESKLAHAVGSRLEDLVAVLLLPAFFAITGLRTEIGLVSGVSAWLAVGVLIVVASLGKFGGTYVAGRLTGLGPYDAGALGIMMNTRGLMELIVLNIGLDLQILSPTLFSMFVLMALATTLMTTPIIDALMPHTNLGTKLAPSCAET